MYIRIADQTDLNAVKDITQETIRRVYPHYYPAGAVEFFLEHHNGTNISRDIENGFVYLCFNAEHAAVGTVTVKNNELCRLFVLPQFQGNGYGRMLLDFAEALIAENFGCIVLDASLPAKNIYLKRGYSITDSRTISVPHGDFLYYDVMRKDPSDKTSDKRL